MVSEKEHLTAYGHHNITADHRTTFEITREEHLTPSGSCIIAVRSDKGAGDLSEKFSEILRQPGSILTTTIFWGDTSVSIIAEGSPDLDLTHPTDLVWRRSSFTCSRTIGIYADHTASTLPRDLISFLREGKRIECTLIAESGQKKDVGEIFPDFIWKKPGAII